MTSTTPKETSANSRFVDGSPVELVSGLKRQPGKDIGVHGSITAAQSLLEQGLVDDLAACHRSGPAHQRSQALRKGLSRRLRLTRNVTSPSGCLVLDFRVGS